MIAFDKVYIVRKACLTTGQSIFQKIFFLREQAELYIRNQKDPELYRYSAFIPSKRDDGTAKELA